MATFALVVTIVSLVVVAVGSFLVHDGYSAHKLVGRVSEGIGAVVVWATQYVQKERLRQDDYDCVINNVCRDSTDGTLHSLVDAVGDMFSGFAIEAVLLWGALLCGWGLAKLTLRSPGPASE